MSELSVLQAFVAAGMTPVGACAMGGNIQAESGFKANIAQRGMTKLSDEEYTAAADRGSIDFANDGVGYGLCQWTYPTRKKALLSFAKEHGKSVGDEQMQVEFCVNELSQIYPSLWTYLTVTQDITEATKKICLEYERPAVNNVSTRTDYAEELYKRFGASSSAVKRGDKSARVLYLAALLTALGYDVLWDGLYNCLVDYQQRKGLPVNGLCDENTWINLTEGR